MSFYIEDWTGKRVSDDTFPDFQSARDRIYEIANEEAFKSGHAEDSPEYEEIYDGVCDDLYAVTDPCEFEKITDHEWSCTTHKCTMLGYNNEPVICAVAQGE